jgi:subtilisin-like proprotein convertase family protein
MPKAGFIGTDTFTYKASDGSLLSNIATVTVQVNAPVTSTYTNSVAAAIPDESSITSTITLSESYRIRDFNVKLNITHTRDSDLQVFLRGPDGTVIELFNAIGGTGQNFQNTVLDDEGTSSITAGVAPFTGTFRPTGNLTLLEDKLVTGTWTLEIRDNVKGRTGTLTNWSLLVEH